MACEPQPFWVRVQSSRLPILMEPWLAEDTDRESEHGAEAWLQDEEVLGRRIG